MLLSRFDIEAEAPPETVLARLRADVHPPGTPPPVVATPVKTGRGWELDYVRVPVAGPEPLYGTVDDGEFEFWARTMLVKVRGRVLASPNGSQIVSALFLENVVILAVVILVALSLVDIAAYLNIDSLRPNVLSPIFVLLLWIALVPLAWIILSDIPRCKNTLTHMIHMGVAEHRLNLDSPAAGDFPEADSRQTPD